MAPVTLYHNPKCSNSRNALDVLESLGIDRDVVRYLEQPPDREALTALLAQLEDPPGDLVRRDPRFKELGLTDADVARADQVVDLLAREPALMQRPVLVKDGRAIIGRPKDRVAPFVSG
jgi:arsenate reductase